MKHKICGGSMTIEQAFMKKNEQGKPAFIPFIVAGYPSVSATIDVALALQEAGADILELGIPYSDPLADGRVIQEASRVALEQGMTLSKGLRLIGELREKGLTIPILPFCYYNPILQYGLDSFVQAAQAAGANGVLVPDLPYEEARDLVQAAKPYHFPCISLVAPTSEQRIQQIVNDAEGFIYCISSLGVTGVREGFATEVTEFLKRVKSEAKIPVAVGFGVSKREHVLYFRDIVDGIVIGSALVQLMIDQREALLDEENRAEALNVVKTFVQLCFSE